MGVVGSIMMPLSGEAASGQRYSGPYDSGQRFSARRIDSEPRSSGFDPGAFEDEILNDLSVLITDVRSGQVGESVLAKEIDRLIASKRGLIDPIQARNSVMNRLFGYDWLQPYVEDEEISDIDLPRYDYAVIRRGGRFETIVSRFQTEEEFERYCRLLVIRSGGTIHQAKPHCRVADPRYRLRINVSIPPRNATGTSLTIRKHREKALTLPQLLELGMLDERSLDAVRRAAGEGRSIVICGKGASGKTTLLRALLQLVPERERILVCESDAEIYTENPNCIVQRVSRQRAEGESTDLDALVEEGLTMSLDTYCIGEITGREAWPFVKAGYSGHRVLATLHAMSAEDAMDRLLMLCSEDTRLPEHRLRAMIEKSIDIVIHLRDFRVRRILALRPAVSVLYAREPGESTEVSGEPGEGGA